MRRGVRCCGWREGRGMRKSRTVTVNSVALMRGCRLVVKVRVTRLRELKLRIWLAKQLIRLAARVLNCGMTLGFEEDGEE